MHHPPVDWYIICSCWGTPVYWDMHMPLSGWGTPVCWDMHMPLSGCWDSMLGLSFLLESVCCSSNQLSIKMNG